jgi:hypothetical protein
VSAHALILCCIPTPLANDGQKQPHGGGGIILKNLVSNIYFLKNHGEIYKKISPMRGVHFKRDKNIFC